MLRREQYVQFILYGILQAETSADGNDQCESRNDRQYCGVSQGHGLDLQIAVKKRFHRKVRDLHKAHQRCAPVVAPYSRHTVFISVRDLIDYLLQEATLLVFILSHTTNLI